MPLSKHMSGGWSITPHIIMPQWNITMLYSSITYHFPHSFPTSNTILIPSVLHQPFSMVPHLLKFFLIFFLHYQGAWPRVERQDRGWPARPEVLPPPHLHLHHHCHPDHHVYRLHRYNNTNQICRPPPQKKFHIIFHVHAEHSIKRQIIFNI